jgi:hypothetical protein
MELDNLVKFLSANFAMIVGTAVLITAIGSVAAALIAILDQRRRNSRGDENQSENLKQIMQEIGGVKDQWKQLSQKWEKNLLELQQNAKALRNEFKELRKEIDDFKADVNDEIGLYRMNKSGEYQTFQAKNSASSSVGQQKEQSQESVDPRSATGNEQGRQSQRKKQESTGDQWAKAKDWLKMTIPIYGQWHAGKKNLEVF